MIAQAAIHARASPAARAARVAD